MTNVKKILAILLDYVSYAVVHLYWRPVKR